MKMTFKVKLKGQIGIKILLKDQIEINLRDENKTRNKLKGPK